MTWRNWMMRGLKNVTNLNVELMNRRNWIIRKITIFHYNHHKSQMLCITLLSSFFFSTLTWGWEIELWTSAKDILGSANWINGSLTNITLLLLSASFYLSFTSLFPMLCLSLIWGGLSSLVEFWWSANIRQQTSTRFKPILISYTQECPITNSTRPWIGLISRQTRIIPRSILISWRGTTYMILWLKKV